MSFIKAAVRLSLTALCGGKAAISTGFSQGRYHIFRLGFRSK
jgi:hypothetical protein